MVRLDEDGKSLAAYGYKEGMVLGFKDLGPQIGYRTGRSVCSGVVCNAVGFAVFWARGFRPPNDGP